MFDLHTHHDRCGHAFGDMESYIRSAIDRGLRAIGVSDHSPYFADDADHPAPKLAMAKGEFPRYIAQALTLKKKYENEIEVLVGVESDIFPQWFSLYADTYRLYPLDYVIGSVHISGGKHLSERKLWAPLADAQMEEEKYDYFNLLQQGAKSGLFDIIGHMDLIKRYYKQFFTSCRTQIDETLQVFADTGVVVEVNTSGMLRQEGFSPCDEVLERARFYNVQLTFGSDSHRSERVGEHWDEVVALMKSFGYKEMTMFRNRKPVRIPIG